MKTLIATRYVTPLREGGSLPGVVEASDGKLYVAKFRGAGQGARALVAEWLAGELARSCGFDVPELVQLELDGAFGRNEPDPEIRDLLRASAGANLGLEFLPGSISYDPIAPPDVGTELASRIVWFDAFVMNVDRTPRNPNLLLARGRLWLIDHGAAFYFHHAWSGAAASRASAFTPVRDHVLLPRAANLPDAGAALRDALRAAPLARLLDAVPDAWLAAPDAPGDPAATRAAYADWFAGRLASASAFEEEAGRARAALV